MPQIPKVLEDLFLKNLNYFKDQNPDIYEVMNKITPDHSKIIIDESGSIDLVYKGRHIYGGNAIDYVEREVEEFNVINKGGLRKVTTKAPSPGVYSVPRFFQSHLNQTITDLYTTAQEININAIHHDGHYDFLVVMGIGLGLHISEILDRLEVQNLLILETDFEFISLSCFFTDWEEIYKKQSTKKGKSITIVAVNSDNEDVEQGSIWNELVKRAPHFPYNTVFYNHGRHAKYGKIIKKISQDQTMYMSLWGYWDDEIAQLNNINYNLKKIIQPNSTLIPKRLDFKWDKPIIICGSGPSLDARIEQIRSIRDNCILLSAGTSLLPLLKNGFTPDFHIEMESDYSVFHSLSKIENTTELKGINLITGIQSNPIITSMFKNVYLFVKDSSATGGLFEKEINKLKDPTPTCINAAYSLALHYNADEIFLFGTDFGFYKKSENHSKFSIYDDSTEDVGNIQKRNKRNINNSFESEGYHGKCFTTNIYFTTKRRIDLATKLKRFSYKFNLNNCSEGLIIEGANHINEDDIITIKLNKEIDTITEFNKKKRSIDIDVDTTINNETLKAINFLCDNLSPALSAINPNKKELSSICWSISHFLSSTYKNKYENIYFFIRGSIWHYMLSGYSISYSVKDEQVEAVIDTWRNRFIEFLNELPEQLKMVTNRELSLDDPSLRSTIRDKLDGF